MRLFLPAILSLLVAVKQTTGEPKEKCELNIDLTLLADMSESMRRGDDLVQLRAFLDTLVDHFELAQNFARMALVSVRDTATIEKDLDDCPTTQCIKDAIAQLSSPSGGTNLEAALETVLHTVFTPQRGDRQGVEDVILLITDGTENKDPVPQALIDETKKRDMRVLVLAVGNAADNDNIFDIGTTPFYENVFFVNTFRQLAGLATELRQLYCVTGLTTPVPPTLLPDSCKYDIGLLVDHSGSIVEIEGSDMIDVNSWIQMRQFLRDFVRTMKEEYKNVRIALERFRRRGTILFNFDGCSNNEDLACMDQAIKSMETPWGDTYMATAFRKMRRDVIEGPANRRDAPDLIIFLTDGFPSKPSEMPQREAQILKDRGVRIYGIGVTDNVNVTILQQVVSPPPSSNYYTAQNYRELANQVKTIIAQTCTVPRKPCEAELDVAVLVDFSDSVLSVPSGFDRLKNFVNGIADGLNFNRARMAVVYFSDAATTYFDLNQCRSSRCVRRLVNNMPSPGGLTNIGAAFEQAVTNVFTPGGGDRPRVPNTIVLVTDGAPNIFDQDRYIQIAKSNPNNRIMVIALTDAADVDTVLGIASEPAWTNLFFVRNFNDLVAELDVVKEFICYEPPVEPSPPPPTPQICRYDIALLVDNSDSVNFHRATKLLRQFLKKFVDKMKNPPAGSDIDVKIALEIFNRDPHILLKFDGCDDNTDLQCIQKIIHDIPRPNYETHMDKAFIKVQELFGCCGDRDDTVAPDLVIFLSDGFPEAHDFQSHNPIPHAQVIKDQGIRILGLGISKEMNHTIMEQVVSQPFEDHYIRVPRYRELESKVDSLIHKACKKRNETRPCKGAGDIIFLLDSSASMNSDDYDTMKDFVIDLIYKLPVNPDGVRVGGAKFSTAYEAIFQLKDHTNPLDMEKKIRAASFMRKDTHTWKVLRYIENTMFTARNGDRDNQDNVLVVFTDGGSQDHQKTIDAAASLKRNKGVTVIVVQIGTWFNYNELRGLTSDPIEKNMVNVKNFKAFDKVEKLVRDRLQQNILDIICNNRSCADDFVCENGGTLLEDDGLCRCVCEDGWVHEKCNRTCEHAADIMLVVDRSGSIDPPEFDQQITFLKKFVLSMNFKQQRVGLLSFADTVLQHLRLEDGNDKKTAVNSMNIPLTGGGTNTYRALDRARQEFRRVGTRTYKGRTVPQVAIVLTDGRSQRQDLTFDSALKLRDAGAYVIAVGVGNGIRQLELEGIASSPSNVILIDNYSQLLSIMEQLYVRICDNPCRKAEVSCPDGSTPVAKYDKCECLCPDGRIGPNCERDCNEALDLAILLDASGSIRNERFPVIRDFAVQLVSSLTVSPTRTRVGAVTWSSRATKEFELDQYKTNHDVCNALKRLQFVGHRTNTYNALDIVARSIFTRRGDRKKIPNFLLMFTDGGSNIHKDRTIPTALRLKQAGVHITIVAVGDDMNPYELRAVASEPGEDNVLWVPRQSQIMTLFERTKDRICEKGNKCNTAPCQNGGTCRNDNSMYWCSCPYQFTGMNCEIQCDRRYVDVVFVLDCSGSVEQVYNIILTFTKRAMRMLNVDRGMVRVGLVAFADDSKVVFDLNDVKTAREAVMRCSLVERRASGRTATYRGLQSAYLNVFTQYRGDRPNVDNVMVVVTDGGSNVRPDLTPREAERARQKGIEIFTVVTGDINMQEANDLASDPDSNHVIHIKNANADMDAGLKTLLERLCSRRLRP